MTIGILPGCSTGCPGYPSTLSVHSSHFAVDFLLESIANGHRVEGMGCAIHRATGVRGRLGKPGTAHRSVAACLEWIQEEVTKGWFPCTNVTALSSQSEKVKTLSKCPRGGETEAWSLGHLVSIRPKSGKRQARGWEGNRAVTLLRTAKRNSGVCPARLVNRSPAPDGNPGIDLSNTRGLEKGCINGCMFTQCCWIAATHNHVG